MQDYASGIICAVQRVCREKHIPVPTIVTESGRALVSHHAVLIFDVISRCAHSLQYVLPCILCSPALHSLLGFLPCVRGPLPMCCIQLSAHDCQHCPKTLRVLSQDV